MTTRTLDFANLITRIGGSIYLKLPAKAKDVLGIDENTLSPRFALDEKKNEIAVVYTFEKSTITFDKEKWKELPTIQEGKKNGSNR